LLPPPHCPEYWRQILSVELFDAAGLECSFAKVIDVTVLAVKGSTNVVIGDTTANGVG
jgi:hypothetical protein